MARRGMRLEADFASRSPPGGEGWAAAPRPLNAGTRGLLSGVSRGQEPRNGGLGSAIPNVRPHPGATVTNTTRIRFIASLAFGLLVGAAAWDCARAEKPKSRVLVVGVDAGEWDVLGPLLNEGKIPNFARMRDQGSAGKLRSLEPLTKSPIIWASIATGKVPQKHGILDFFVKQRAKERAREGATNASEGESPATSNLWRARPIWQILGGLGRTVGVVGWWTTLPAQPV